MKIDKIRVLPVLLPFSQKFAHSQKKAVSAENVIVEITADHGETFGYGEGAPRPYVTWETQGTVSKSIQKFVQKKTFPWELNNVSEIWDFVDTLPSEKMHNSAICALEMALLDAFAGKQGLNIMEYLPKEFITDKIFYGASIPLGDIRQITKISNLIRRLDIQALRLKMGQDFDQNRDAFKIVQSIFGKDCDLRIDINGAWNLKLALNHLPLINENRVRVVEQPMMPGATDLSEFAGALAESGTVLMADESACTIAEIKDIINEGLFKMVNIRLSKCGGFRRSLKMINLLRTSGLKFQIGCQLGESGMLSTAGRVLSLLSKDALYHDGSYDKYLLSENVTVEDISFGPGGEAGRLEGPGIGFKVDHKSLDRLTGSPTVIRITKP